MIVFVISAYGNVVYVGTEEQSVNALADSIIDALNIHESVEKQYGLLRTFYVDTNDDSVVVEVLKIETHDPSLVIGLINNLPH